MVGWSKSWKSSVSPRKQRNYVSDAPLHVRRKLIVANLSKELRKKYNKRSVVLRKGDKVTVMRGSNKGKSGKIKEIEIRNLKVLVDGVDRVKKDGSKIDIRLQPSNLMVTELVLDDKKRKNMLERKKE